MKFEINEIYHGFKLLQEEKINEIGSIARVFEHNKSGARLLNLENDDDNKMFSIGFRTTPTDSTGVAHILEHSVLCGSRKFKTKDPFGDMAKSSLNTYLNASTYTDKTVYPVASRDDKDFMNLMDVYLDAVLYPKIYENHEILRQEGWRYETDSETGDLIYKGVVYSEMQGALSSPEEVICSDIYKSLFPNTTYAFVSGGAPEEIPNLNQDDFEKFHSKFYHPSNSYIVLSGNMDIDKCLKFINDEYLVNFDKIEIPSHIDRVDAFDEMKKLTSEYSISEEEEEKNKAFLALNYVFGDTCDPMEYLTTKILYNMLIESSASPIKESLLKAGIGECLITADEMNMDPTMQILFPIVVKNTEASKEDEFKEIILSTLKEMVNKGIDKDILKAAINTVEFELREADPWISANKGIEYRDWALNSWIYDGNPLIHLRYEDNFNKIKAAAEKGYFEEFIRTHMIENTHCSLVTLKPKKGLAEEKVKDLKEKLEIYKKSLSKEELKALDDRNELMRQSQVRIDTEEEKRTIPKLDLREISRNVEEIPQEVVKEKGVTILNHKIPTSKIAYINLLFDASVIEEEDIPYLGILASMLGELDTRQRKYSQLITEINKNTGGIEFTNEVYSKDNDANEYYPKFIIKSKVISNNIPTSFELIKEIITSTKFEDGVRIKQVIQELKSKLQMRIINAGHVIAMNRVFSNFSYAMEYWNRINDGAYYEFICDLEKNLDNNIHEIKENLIRVYKTIFNKNNLIVSVVGEDEEINSVQSAINIILDELEEMECGRASYKFENSNSTQGIITASNVQYAVKGFNFAKLGCKYSGKLKVLQNVLESDYLYPMVRLQGGAYGCYMQVLRNGNLAAYSYRDPNLSRTLDVYDDIYKFIEELDIVRGDMENFIIGTIGREYKPLTPDRKGEKAVVDYIIGRNYEDEQREKEEILSTTLEDIKAYSNLFKAGMNENHCCVVGNEKKIKENKKIFDNIKVLF